MSNFHIIGLTGPSGAGKSTVAAQFELHGAAVIDADRVYHELLIPPSRCLDALTAEFSPAILSLDGTLNRPSLAALVFGNDDASCARRARLNEITHRFVIERTNELLDYYRSQGRSTVLIDAPLLIEANMHRMCHFTICVLAPVQTRIRRLMARDQKSEADIRARICSQHEDDFYLSHCDTAIHTDDHTTPQSLNARVQEILRQVEDLP